MVLAKQGGGKSFNFSEYAALKRLHYLCAYPSSFFAFAHFYLHPVKNNRHQTVFSTAGEHHVNGCDIREGGGRIKPFLCDAIISSFSSSYCYVMTGGKAGKHLAGDRNGTRMQSRPEDIKKGYTIRLKNILRGERSNLFLEAFRKIDCLAAGNQYLTIKEKLSQNWRKSESKN